MADGLSRVGSTTIINNCREETISEEDKQVILRNYHIESGHG